MSTPPTISDDGRLWNLNKAGEDPIPFAVADADLSASTVIFKVDGGPTVTLQPNPAVATGKLLVFSLEELAAIPPRGASFFIRNETSGQVYLDGKVFARGFA